VIGFPQVKDILDAAVGGAAAPVGGPHGAFWRPQTRDQFVAFTFLGLKLVNVGNGAGSTIVKALRGQAPFGSDIGTPGAGLRRMPAGRPPVPPGQVDEISAWIDAGCPDQVAGVGAVEALLGGTPGSAFLVVGDPPAPGRLRLRTTDGSQGEVTVRAAAGGVATLDVVPAVVTVSSAPTDVAVTATTMSTALDDTAIEVVSGATVLASVTLTAVARPAVRFRGAFQCRLATDPDAFDDPRGHDSSFGMFAVEGPDPAHPDEPPLDRIVRLHDAVALRPFCDPIGVTVTGIEAQVGGTTVTFPTGDDLVGEAVRLGPQCVFDGRNRTFAPDGFEPIADFRLEIGAVGGAAFAGASAPAVPRSSPADPHGSTAPYADGISLLDADPTGGRPADYGLGATTWAENAWATLASKLALLVASPSSDDAAGRIRDRRIREHTDARPGHGLAAMATPLVLMQRYTGLIDREITVAPDPHGVLAHLAGLATVRVTLDFLAFDTDCQTGRVTGTLGAPDPTPDAGAETAAPGARVAERSVGLRRVPLDEQ
jgi:hypothetical protein